MIAAFFEALFESMAELLFVTLGVRRTFALIFLVIGLVALNAGSYESSGVFLAISLGLFAWDAVARKRKDQAGL
jgi:hypothetical protein